MRLSPRDILLWRTAGSLALHPDGSRVAFVELHCDEEADQNRSQIWVVPTDGSAPARKVTSGDRDTSPRWSPDGRWLAFVSARETDWRSDLYVLDMSRGGDARLAVTLPRGVDDYAWGPDSASFALLGKPEYPDDPYRPSDDPDERRQRYQQRVVHVERMHHRRDGQPLTDDEQSWVWWAPLDGGDPRPLVESDFPVQSPGWTPDGRICFLSSRDPDHELTWNTQLWAVAVTGGEPEQLTRTDGPVLGYDFTASGQLACVVYPALGLPVGCHDDILLVDGVEVSKGLGRPIGKHVLADTVDPGARSSTPTCSGDSVYVQVTDAGAVHLYRYADGSLERIVEGERVVGEFAVAGDTLVFTSTSPTDAASIRACRADGSQESVVHDPNPWIGEREVSEWQEIWTTTDGVRAQAWVMLAPGEPDAAPPGILSLHGGPHAAYGWSYNLLLQMLAAPGYSVIFGNPPGSLGYGEDFTRLTHQAWGEADLPAMMSFCDEAVAQGWADPDRLGVTGGSYGGFLTLWTIGHSDRFKAALAARPVVNQESIYGSSEFGWALQAGCFQATPWEDPDLYRRLSPLTYAPDIHTPLRLIGCSVDMRVPMEQVEQMYIRLKALGREVDLVVFRGSHMFIYNGPPWGRVAHMDAIVEWFARYLDVSSST